MLYLNRLIHFSLSRPEIAAYPVYGLTGASLCLSLHPTQKIAAKLSVYALMRFSYNVADVRLGQETATRD